METTRVLLVDDHQHFRDGMRALLLSAPDIEVVGEAADLGLHIGPRAKVLRSSLYFE